MLCPRSVPSTKRLIRSPENRAGIISRESNPTTRFYTTRVKLGNTQREQMTSAVHPTTDIAKILRHVRWVDPAFSSRCGREAQFAISWPVVEQLVFNGKLWTVVCEKNSRMNFDRYRRPIAMSDPGRHAALFDGLPRDTGALRVAGSADPSAHCRVLPFDPFV